MSNFPLKKPGTIRLIAAADLHLGRRISVPEVIENSFLTPEGVWENLVDLVLDPNVGADALLLAGDIFDKEEDILEAPYFFEMASYFQKSDLIISRAGATTVAELIASRKASLLIPFSQAAENHQLFNARELERLQAAEVVLEEEFSAQLFADKISYFLKKKEKISQMESRLAQLQTENVAERISDLCFELMRRKGVIGW